MKYIVIIPVSGKAEIDRMHSLGWEDLKHVVRDGMHYGVGWEVNKVLLNQIFKGNEKLKERSLIFDIQQSKKKKLDSSVTENRGRPKKK
jgi:hypothetical protein